MTELKTTKYFWILVNITLSDIITSLSTILYFSCGIRILIFKKFFTLIPYLVYMTAQILVVYAAVSRYLVLLISSIERYIAVCKPHVYKTNYLVNNTNKFFGSAYFLALPYSVLIHGEILSQLCWSPIKVGYASIKYRILPIVMLTFTILTLSLVITIFLVKVWKKLRIMAKRPVATKSNKTLPAASKFVIWTYTIHQITNLPLIIFLVYQLLETSEQVFLIEASTAIFISFYGIGNVALFAYFHSKYILTIKRILKINWFNNRVQPSTTTSDETT